jgi:hypothetical protein
MAGEKPKSKSTLCLDCGCEMTLREDCLGNGRCYCCDEEYRRKSAIKSKRLFEFPDRDS